MSAVQVVLGVATALLTVVAVGAGDADRGADGGDHPRGSAGRDAHRPVRAAAEDDAGETLGHTRMLKWGLVGVAHWFVMVGFGALVLTLVEAVGETFDPAFEIRGWASGLVRVVRRVDRGDDGAGHRS